VTETIASAQKSVASGKASDAVKTIDNAIKLTTDVKSRSYLQLVKSTTYYNDGNYDGALDAALASEANNRDSNIEQVIATIYEQKGDKKDAVNYYQKAIGLVDKSSPTGSSDIQYYQNKIDYLNGVKK